MSWLRTLSRRHAFYARRARQQLLFGSAFLVACFVLGRLALDAGLTWDELMQIQYGDYVLAWFRSDFRDDSALTYKNLYLYGGLFDATAQWLVSKLAPPHDILSVRHVLSAVVAVLGACASYACAAQVAGKRAGVIAGLMLLLTPTWLGHGLFNPKDVPFGAAAGFASYAALRIATRTSMLSWGDAAFAGLCCGIALAVRPGGLFLLSYPLLAAYGRWLLDATSTSGRGRPLRSTLQAGGSITLRLIFTCSLAWLLMISTWPWAQQAPFTRPFAGLAEAAHFSWDANMLYRGEFISSMHVPADYLFVWFGITLPETYLVAVLCGCIELAATGRRIALRHRRAFALCLLAWFVVSPLLAVLIVHPVIYDAHRHFLFILPPLAALAGVALARFFEDRALGRVRLAIACALAAVAMLVVFDMASLHPYEYIYFNRSSGGLRAASGRFETDYWGASYREGFAWLVEHYRNPRGMRRFRVAACNEDPQIEYYLSRWPEAAQKFVLTPNHERARLYLAVTRSDCNQTNGRVIHTVERQGVPLLYIFER
jgi:hypothetical protein